MAVRPQAHMLLTRALVGSLLFHFAILGAAGAGALFDARLRAPPQNVLTARLVRLGAARPEALLPRKAPETVAPPPAPALPKSVPVPPPVASPAPTPPDPKSQVPSPKQPAPLGFTNKAPEAPLSAPADARARISELGRVSQALDRLRRKADGKEDGDVLGETDVAQAGDAFASAVKACLERNYVIEGADPARVRGLTAQVVLRIQSDGTIINFHLARASGVKAFDDAVARAVKRCKKTQAPPQAWRRVVGEEGIEIEFQP